MDKEKHGQTNQQKDPTALITKIGLAAVFLLGVLLIFLGIRAQRDFASSGFSTENAYQVIYTLSRDVENAWQKSVKPGLNDLSDSEKASLDEIVVGLLKDAAEAQRKGAGAEAEADARSADESHRVKESVQKRKLMHDLRMSRRIISFFIRHTLSMVPKSPRPDAK